VMMNQKAKTAPVLSMEDKKQKFCMKSKLDNRLKDSTARDIALRLNVGEQADLHNLKIDDTFGCDVVNVVDTYSDSESEEGGDKKKRRHSRITPTAQRYFKPKDKSFVCLGCGQFGHKKNRCPQRYALCYLCAEMGHQSRFCPNKCCGRCGVSGHKAARCNNRNYIRHRCYRCGSIQHSTEHCTQERALKKKYEDSDMTSCVNCGDSGHVASQCNEPTFDYFNRQMNIYLPEEVYLSYADRVGARQYYGGGRRNSTGGSKRSRDYRDRNDRNDRPHKRRRQSVSGSGDRRNGGYRRSSGSSRTTDYDPHRRSSGNGDLPRGSSGSNSRRKGDRDDNKSSEKPKSVIRDKFQL